MGVRQVTTAALLLMSAVAVAGAPAPARAQAAPASHPIPQSILLKHEDDIRQLAIFVKRPGQLGVVARKALELIRRHHQREVDYILPPLSLLPALAEGKVTPDMRWAIAMSDKVKATSEEIFREHSAITDVMNELLVEAQKVDDKDAADFARDEVGDSLDDLEIQEPTAILVGEVLRARLGAAK